MEKVKKERESNIELLRIVAMVLIIMHYVIFHNGILSIENGTNQLLASILYGGGKIAVIIFVLIVGYYGKNFKFDIKKIIKIIVKLFIYTILISLIFWGIKFNEISFQKIEALMSMYWFINAYLILYMLIPLINICIREIPKKMKVIIFLLMTIIFLISNEKLSAWIYFIYYYICGIAILPYLVKMYDKQILNIGIIIILYSVIVIFNLQMKQNTILLLLIAMFIFVAFKNLKNIKNKKINKISKYTLGVYMIHDNFFIRNNIIINKLHIKEIYTQSFFCIYIIVISLIIFIVCTVIDVMLEKVLEKIEFKNKFLNKVYEKINNTVNLLIATKVVKQK